LGWFRAGERFTSAVHDAHSGLQRRRWRRDRKFTIDCGDRFMTGAVSAGPTPSTVAEVGRGRLALIYQESLTAVTRLRAHRETVTDVAAFREHMLELLRRAEKVGQSQGYDPADLQLSSFGVVALLDESALSSPEGAWSDWARRPLQEQLFGGHMAGEWFFQHIERLLARPDTPALADVLELHELCLLLGFRGRYGAGDRGALHAITAQLNERIRRIRGIPTEFVAGWKPADDAIAVADPWIRRLTTALIASLALGLVLWGVGMFSLRSAVSGIAVPASAPSH
jgi:type VI secretion system protein ImpK